MTKANSGNEPTKLTLTGTVNFQAAEETADGEGPSRPKFTIAAYSGAPVEVGGFYSPVILELSGMRTAKQNIPILRDHDPSRIVGMSDEVAIDAAGARVGGMVTGDNADAQEVVSQAKNGFQWEASVGANITRREFLEAGKKANVNGREVAGPMIIARESVLREVSFVALGADHQTSATVAANQLREEVQMDAKLKSWIEAKGLNPEELDEGQVNVLEAAFKADAKPQRQHDVQDVIADAKKDQQRRAAIAELTAQFIAENPRCDQDFIAKVEALADQAVEAGWSEEKYDTELLRASRPNPGLTFYSKQSRRLTNRVVEAAIAMAGRLEGHEQMYDDQTLQLAHDQFKSGIGLKQLFLMCAEANGYRGSYASDVTVEVQRTAFGMGGPNFLQANQGFSTLSISTILSNTANKFLRMGWDAVDMTPLRIAAVRPVRDFKQITTVSLTGGLEYEKVGPSGEIPHGTLGELSYTNKADTYAKMLAITRTDIINDDLGALTQVPRKLGRGAALKLNDIFWTAFLGGVSANFFSSGNSNLLDGVATMTLQGLTRAEALFLNQTDPDGYPVGVMPKIIVVPTALKAQAVALMDPQRTLITGANTTIPAANVFAGRFRVESSPYISNSSYTGNTSVGWWMLADPEELPMIEIVALNGRVEPVVETADAEFNTLGVQMRGYSDVGVSRQEYRAAIYADGGES